MAHVVCVSVLALAFWQNQRQHVLGLRQNTGLLHPLRHFLLCGYKWQVGVQKKTLKGIRPRDVPVGKLLNHKFRGWEDTVGGLSQHTLFVWLVFILFRGNQCWPVLGQTVQGEMCVVFSTYKLICVSVIKQQNYQADQNSILCCQTLQLRNQKKSCISSQSCSPTRTSFWSALMSALFLPTNRRSRHLWPFQHEVPTVFATDTFAEYSFLTEQGFCYFMSVKNASSRL